MILKMMNTNTGNVLIDNIEQCTRVGVSHDLGDTVEVICLNKKVKKLYKKEEILYDIISLYNLSKEIKIMHVFNLVIRSVVDNRKEFRTVLFRGPGYLMNDGGHTIEQYDLLE